ncbi:MAG TPA: type II secretion system protein GspC [Candidatus Deferrimicrobiaceae bacterium]
MRKPVYLGVLGMAIVVSAVSLGVTLTRYLSLRAYSPKTPPGSAPPPAESVSPPSPVEEWRNPFSPSQGMKTPSRLPAAASKGGAPASRTNFTLVGTIVSDTPSARRAILWAEGMKEPRGYRESEEVEPGAVLAAVERDRVFLARGNEREKLDLLPVGSRTRTPPPPPAAPQPSAAQVPSQPAGDIRVTKLSDTQYSIDEGGVAQLTGNFNQFMTQVRMVPYFEGNKSAGYRIAAVRPGTTFEKLGFQGGDVLQQVNGLDLSSPDKVYTIFQNLKDEKKVTVSILRQGQKNTLTYEIR